MRLPRHIQIGICTSQEGEQAPVDCIEVNQPTGATKARHLNGVRMDNSGLVAGEPPGRSQFIRSHIPVSPNHIGETSQ
eukprot:6226421-Alexandrium_andersonii.AAC.1